MNIVYLKLDYLYKINTLISTIENIIIYAETLFIRISFFNRRPILIY